MMLGYDLAFGNWFHLERIMDRNLSVAIIVVALVMGTSAMACAWILSPRPQRYEFVELLVWTANGSESEALYRCDRVTGKVEFVVRASVSNTAGGTPPYRAINE